LVIRILNLEIFLFCQHNSTGGGNLELETNYSLIFLLLLSPSQNSAVVCDFNLS
jgi:hypothetical protein